jgi:MFS family permease
LDLISFGVAVAAVFAVRIPRPPQSEAGKAAQGSVWKESRGGLVYLYQRKTLFTLLVYISLVNFMFSSAMSLQTPYLLSRTGSTETMGSLLSLMNIGALAGGIIIGVWGGTRPRMNTMMPGLIVSGLALAGVGMSQQPIPLGVMMVVMMFPLPMINTLFISMMQSKVAPDIQGRVFAVMNQMSMFLMPLAYLIAGPLADNVFKPAVTQPGWERVAPLVGSGAGSGFGLMMVIFGAFIGITAIAVYAVPAIRRLEINLPDYVIPEDEPELAGIPTTSDAVSA